MQQPVETTEPADNEKETKPAEQETKPETQPDKKKDEKQTKDKKGETALELLLRVHYRNTEGEQIFRKKTNKNATIHEALEKEAENAAWRQEVVLSDTTLLFSYFAKDPDGAPLDSSLPFSAFMKQSPVVEQPGSASAEKAIETLNLYVVYDVAHHVPGAGLDSEQDVNVPTGSLPLEFNLADLPGREAPAKRNALRSSRDSRATGWEHITYDHPTEPGQVKLFKDVRLLEGEDLVNTYEIKLRIEAKDFEQPADIVLVLDNSNSMGEGTKMESARNAAISLVKKLIPNEQSLNRVALISYGGTVVKLSDLTGSAAALETKINTLYGNNGGTFTQAAIHEAEKLLNTQGRAKALKSIVLLSDGFPTYAYWPTGTAKRTIRYTGKVSKHGEYGDYVDEVVDHLYRENTPEETKFREGRYGTGMAMRHAEGTTTYQGYLYDFLLNCGNAAISQATKAKNRDYKLFTVGFEAGDVGNEVLSQIASPGSAYTATESELNAVFQKIAGSILDAVKNAKVSDPMGHGFTIPSEASLVSYAPEVPGREPRVENNTIYWDVSKLTPVEEAGVEGVSYAEIIYRIEITDDILTATANGENYNTNGDAQFTYEDSQGEQQTLHFPVPEVNPVLYKVQKVVLDKDGNDITSTLTGANKRTFNVLVRSKSEDNHYEADYLLDTDKYNSSRLITTLRDITDYTFEENEASHGSISADYYTEYYVDGQLVASTENGPLTKLPEFRVESNSQKDINLKIVNRERPARLLVSKAVVPARSDGYEFSFTLQKPDGTTESFKLTDGQTKIFEDLPYGSYVVTEAKDPSYFTEMHVDEETVQAVNTLTVKLDVTKRERSVYVTNTSKEIFGLSAYKHWIDNGESVKHPDVYFQLYQRLPVSPFTEKKIGPRRKLPAENPGRVEWSENDKPTVEDPEYPKNLNRYYKSGDDFLPYEYFLKEVDENGEEIGEGEGQSKLPLYWSYIPNKEFGTEDPAENPVHVYNYRDRTSDLSLKKKLLPETVSVGDFRFLFTIYKRVGVGQYEEYLTARNFGDTVTFTDLDLPGIPGEDHAITYKIVEQADASKPYLIYDTNVFLVKIYTTVNEDPTKPLDVNFRYYRFKNPTGTDEASNLEEIPEAEFIYTNTYKATGTWLPVFGKDLVGRGRYPKPGEFSFELKNDQTGATMTLKNDNYGVVMPDKPIKFTEADIGQTYTYTVKEIIPSQVEEGMTYDTKTLHFTVSVVDNKDGTLDIQVDSEENPTFENVYSAKTEWTPKAQKTLTGRPLKDKEFRFVLKNKAGEVIDTASNDAAGLVSFKSIEYTQEDIGYTYTYTIAELRPDTPETGMEYDSTEHTFTVAIQDGGSGTLKLVFDPAMEEPVGFTNTYTAKGAWTPEVSKALTGRPLKPEEFSFVLKRDGVKVGEAVKNTGDGKVQFPEISFNQNEVREAPYIFTIEELVPDSPENGMTYDNMVVTIPVTVSDAGNGKLTVTAKYPADTVFNNIYEAEGERIPHASKKLTGRPLEAGEFKFVLEREGVQIGAPVTNAADGKILFNPVKFSAADIALSPIHFTIRELVPEEADKEKGMTYDPMVIQIVTTVEDAGGGQLTITSVYPEDTEFNNSYEARGSWTPEVTKVLTGRALQAGEFSFVLKQDGKPVGEPVKNNADGSIPFQAVEVDQTAIGQTLHYTITEVKPDKPEQGMTYDPLEIKIDVAVTDLKNGELKATPTYSGDTEFNNSYAAEGSWIPAVTKKLVGRELTEDAFEFVLTGPEGEVARVKNKADGSVTFPKVSYSQEDLNRTYHYTITEAVPATPEAGMSYDGLEVGIDVSITDAGGGKLTVTPTYTEDTEFDNSYKAEGSFIPQVAKSLSGRKLTDKAFSFVLKQDGTVVSEAKNDLSGKVLFDKITYHETDIGKTFTYKITEKQPDAPETGMIYDKHEVTLTVKVEDAGSGVLNIVTSYSGETTFLNRYEAEGTWTPEVTKVLTGRELSASEFSFALIRLNGSQETRLQTVTNTAGGTIPFEAVKYTQKDIGKTYTYLVRELQETKLPGVTYDTLELRYTVEIRDKTNGVLDVIASKPEDTEFNNSYSASGTWTPVVTKLLAGRALEDREFTFRLYEVGEAGAETLRQEKQNAADGSIPFETISYSEAQAGKTYRYKIVEVEPAEADRLPGITYDKLVVEYTVTVTDERTGKLKIEASEPADTEFHNIYGATGNWTPVVTKTLKGRELAEGEFHFRLLEATTDTAGKPVETELQVATNAADGSIAFKPVAYTEADVGTHHYIIEEREEALPGVTYDKTRKLFTVEVSDSGTGKLTVEATTPADTAFVNVYTPTLEWKPVVHKVLEGAELEENQFVFVLRDENGRELQMKRNDALGVVRFDAVKLDSLAVGQSRRFTVSELPVGLDYYGFGWTVFYDTHVVTFTVTPVRTPDGITLKVENDSSLIFRNWVDTFKFPFIPHKDPDKDPVPDTGASLAK